MRSNVVTAALAALFLTAGGAAAANPPPYPTTVAGTWSIEGNGVDGTLVLAQAAGTTPCRAVTGTIYGSHPVKGTYCPLTGRLVFGRNPGGITIQVWAAQLSRGATNANVMMTGSLTAVTAAGGAPGEYAFWGSRP